MVLPQIHLYDVKQGEIDANNPHVRRCDYTTKNTFWKVQYYDKSSFNRTKTITTKQPSYMIKNLLKKENQFTPVWNSEKHLSEFIFNRFIDWTQTPI